MAWFWARIYGFCGADAPLLGDNSCSCGGQTGGLRSANTWVLGQNKAFFVVFCRVLRGVESMRGMYVAVLQLIVKIAKNSVFVSLSGASGKNASISSLNCKVIYCTPSASGGFYSRQSYQFVFFTVTKLKRPSCLRHTKTSLVLLRKGLGDYDFSLSPFPPINLLCSRSKFSKK